MSRLPAARDTWILDGILYTQDAKRRVMPAHLRIVDGRIATITSRRPAKIPKGTAVIQAAGQVILPGFVQAHVHLVVAVC